MATAAVKGISLEYDTHGDPQDETILLVMGLGGQLVAWPLEFVERLVAAGFHVVRFDNRDIGLSTKIDAPVPTTRQLVLSVLSRRFAKPAYLLTDMADDAIGLLDHLSIPRAHVLGASMGGMISQTMAIRHPDRVLSLTSIMSNTGDRRHGAISTSLLRKMPKLMTGTAADAIENGVEMFRLISGPRFDEAKAREWVVTAFERSYCPEGAARQTMAIMGSPDRTADLAQVTVPTLVIHGLADRLVKPSGGVTTAKAVPGSRLVMYPDMGHDLPEHRWDEMIGEIVQNTRRATANALRS